MKNIIKKTLSAMSAVLLLATCLQIQPLFADNKSQNVINLLGNTTEGWGFTHVYWTIGTARLDPENRKKLIVLPIENNSPELINTQKDGVNIFTTQSFGDCVVELEVMVAEDANSGIHLMGQYEVAVNDSFGKDWLIKTNDMGGIVDTAKPKVNAAKKAGIWQTYRIEFKAPRFKNGQRTEPAEFIKVILNGQIVQEHVKMENGPTASALKKGEFPTGPLMFQGNMGAVAYRNIKIIVP